MFSEKLLHLTYKNLLAVFSGFLLRLYFKQIHALINTVCSFIVLNDRISVENAFIDEKEDACSALGELALNTG